MGLVVKFSVLQEYGVDRVFLLETGNVDSSQKNVIFIARAEKPEQIKLTTGELNCLTFVHSFITGVISMKLVSLFRTSCQAGCYQIKSLY